MPLGIIVRGDYLIIQFLELIVRTAKRKECGTWWNADDFFFSLVLILSGGFFENTCC